jgi:hypothetical protein
MDSIDLSFGIDHNQPGIYLTPGEQSRLDSIFLQEIVDRIGPPAHEIYFIRQLCDWINVFFTWENAGGAMIGEKNANELFEEGKLYGCHSAALLICSALRGFGFPAVMIETASISWGFAQYEGNADGMIGHVMNEIYVNDHWILLDNNGDYIDEYDPNNPYISTTNPPIKDLWVIAKGLDTWEYYEKTNADTHKLMMDFAENIYCYEPMFYTIDYEWLQ